MEKTTLYLPADLQRGLRDAARRAGRPQAELVRDALAAYLGSQPAPRPRSLGAGTDDGLTARESEAWLRAEWSGSDHPRHIRRPRPAQPARPRSRKR